MEFKRHIKAKESLDIGIITLCRSILEKMNGIILTIDQSEQERKLFHDKDIWRDPKIKTAADFDWLEPWLLNKISTASIVIAQFDNQFVINKNTKFPITRGHSVDIMDLYPIILYWYGKNRKSRIRKKWRTLETGERIFA